MEPGSVPGAFYVSLTTLYGRDFEGGHFSRGGTTADGNAIAMPLYRHEVSLDYARVEIELRYTLPRGWDVIARLPWEQKDQRARAAFLDVPTDEQRTATQRNIDLHHRSTTLRGMSDLMFLARHRRSGLWREGDTLTVSGGLSMPTGKTVENPYRLGDQGVQHLHIQFGTGTIDPLIEGSYSAPLYGRVSAGAYFAGRLSLYENRRSFRGPPEASVGLHLSHATTDRLRLRVEGGGFVQGYGHWDGVRDENTGLVTISLGGGATVRVSSIYLSADARFPISQRTLAEGDAFKQGPTFVVAFGSRLY